MPVADRQRIGVSANHATRTDTTDMIAAKIVACVCTRKKTCRASFATVTAATIGACHRVSGARRIRWKDESRSDAARSNGSVSVMLDNAPVNPAADVDVDFRSGVDRRSG